MKKLTKALAAIMLMTVAMLFTQCNNAPTQKSQENTNTEVKQTKGMIGGHEYVDLGLPSGLLWATCNVGANNPEDYGNYYAWGETRTKDIYNYDSYFYSKNRELTKYCYRFGFNGFTDNLTVLQADDDAAISNWGGGWRMPSDFEWQELLDNTTNTWATLNGVNGRLFTASNGVTLFLPAADWYDCSYGVNYCGSYWSSSLSEDNPYAAWGLGFNKDGCSMIDPLRIDGYSVRPVRSAR